MFGFMRPACERLEYRSVYSRACQHARQHHGLLALPFHSYEAVFLYALCLDAKVGLPAPAATTCCWLRIAPRTLSPAESQVSEFCSSFALLLAGIKLDDDVHDNGGLVARLARFVFRGRVRRANRYFARLDPHFGRRVRAFLADHARLEVERNATLAEYTRPTAEAFAYVFGLAARLPTLAPLADLLSEVGYELGAAIIAFDCAVDWRADHRANRFNPVTSEQQADAARRLCVSHLERIRRACSSRLGTDSQSAAIAASVAVRLSRGQSTSCSTTPRVGFWQRLKPQLDRLAALNGRPRYLYSDVCGLVGVMAAVAVVTVSCLGPAGPTGSPENPDANIRSRRENSNPCCDATCCAGQGACEGIDCCAGACGACSC